MDFTTDGVLFWHSDLEKETARAALRSALASIDTEPARAIREDVDGSKIAPAHERERTLVERARDAGFLPLVGIRDGFVDDPILCVVIFDRDTGRAGMISRDRDSWTGATFYEITPDDRIARAASAIGR